MSSEPIDTIYKPNIFRDNKGLTMETEIKFILSQYAEYKNKTYSDDFIYNDQKGNRYVILITITKE